jgi:hypothetical protein
MGAACDSADAGLLSNAVWTQKCVAYGLSSRSSKRGGCCCCCSISIVVAVAVTRSASFVFGSFGPSARVFSFWCGWFWFDRPAEAVSNYDELMTVRVLNNDDVLIKRVVC